MPNVTADPSSQPPSAALSTGRAVLLVFLPFAGGYFLSYMVRSLNAVIAPQLIGEIGLTAGDLGLLTSVYFITFGAFQLPLGVLLDRYGPRRVQSALLLLAALGALLFSLGHSRESLLVGRGLIGLGFAGGLMSSFKAITLWFPQQRWPLVNGCFLAMGGLGAIFATRPVEFLLGYTDWRGIFLGACVVVVAASSLIFLVVPEKPRSGPAVTLKRQVAGLGIVFRDRFFWRLMPISSSTMGTGLAVQGLWAGPWLHDVAGFDRGRVAGTLFALTVGMTVGMVGSGLITEALGRLRISVFQVLCGGTMLFILLQCMFVFELAVGAVWPWVAFGFLSNIAVLAYPLLSSHFDLRYSGTANTGLNVLVIGGAFGVQYGIGAIIDLWPPLPGGGFAPPAYAAAFGIILALQALTFLWVLVPEGRGSKADAKAVA
ncbi:MAG: MFS transporter [Candidatus Lambdaproteobacteria bacterium]|nr:MFS transporter [Candidatus Lambdaproteobacteria bacterium]